MAYVAGSRQGTSTASHLTAECSSGPARRIAVLIDARTTPAEHADAVFDAVAQRGSVTVCRAYADWTAPDVRAWLPVLGTHGVQPQHPVASTDRRSVVATTVAIAVAMAIDAVDIARESVVGTIAIVGDLDPVRPLVPRLHALGVSVLGFGLRDASYDVRALRERFADVTILDADAAPDRRRHRT